MAIVSIGKIECLSCILGIVECKRGYSIGIGGSLSRRYELLWTIELLVVGVAIASVDFKFVRMRMTTIFQVRKKSPELSFLQPSRDRKG